MPLVDLIVVGVIFAAAALGYRHGLMTRALVLVGFGVGAFLGSLVAVPVLGRALPDPYGPMLAIPAVLVCGVLLAIALERAGVRLGLHDRATADAAGGALLAAAVGLLAVWIVAPLAGRVDALSASVGDSAIVDGLSAVVAPPEFLVGAEGSDPEGPGSRARARRTRVNVTRDPEVRAARASVVKIQATGCGSRRLGTGWIAADGIVVTYAPAVAQSDALALQVEGRSQSHVAEAVFYDEKSDIALLRSAGVSGEPALPIETKARPGSQLAMLGYPGGGAYAAEPARLGVSSTVRAVEEKGYDPRARQTKTLIADTRAVSAGGPVVDLKGHVVGVAFGRQAAGISAYAVPADASYALPPAAVQHALRSAEDGPVDTGACEED